ncbi:MAG TPA: hypothetical protein VFY37_02035 [Solirubrobacterales bacterium]|nr:hypothetical protein [Solirubrobacterales bacterium]
MIFTALEFTVFPFPIFLGPIWIVVSVGLGIYALRQADRAATSSGYAPRRVRRRLIISDFAAHLMQPGLVLPVYVNPRDPDDILVVW